MAQIKIEWPAPPADGAEVKFKAPCDCTAVTGILLSFPAADGSEGAQAFTFRDSHGNDLTGLGNLFSAGAYIKVILDTGRGHAYLQNAATNTYLENKTKAVAVNLPVSAWVDNSQTVDVAGVTAECSLVVSAAPECFADYSGSGVRATSQAVGAMTFVCDDVPLADVVANVLIVG